MNKPKDDRGIAALAKAVRAIAFAALLLSGLALFAQQVEPEDGAYSMGAQGRMVRGIITATATPDRFTLKTGRATSSRSSSPRTRG